ncbi:MAG: hypothetical protein AABO41_22180 [Acidobacteriota bacterium]
MVQANAYTQHGPGLKSIFWKPKVQTTLALTLGLIVSCSAAALVSRATNQPMPEPSRRAATNMTAPAPAASVGQGLPGQRGPVQVVRFALYDVGIYPREAHAAKGLVALSFEDLSGGSSYLVIERETGAAPESVGRVQRAGPDARGRNDLRLEPGKYRAYVADRPDNQATLIVEP